MCFHNPCHAHVIFRGLRGAAAASATVAAAAAAATASFRVTTQALGTIDYGDPEKVRQLEQTYQTPEVVGQRRAMVAMLKPVPGDKVLDIGCGPGFFMRDIANAVGSSGRLDGIDPSETMCELARQRLSDCKVPNSVVLGGAESLPYADESFDAVILAQVLLYVPDVPKALSEVHRVLRPGGTLRTFQPGPSALARPNVPCSIFGTCRACYHL